MFLALLTYVGIVVFAASGALAGVRRRLDLFGVCVVGCVGVVLNFLTGKLESHLLRWRNGATGGYAVRGD